MSVFFFMMSNKISLNSEVEELSPSKIDIQMLKNETSLYYFDTKSTELNIYQVV